MSPQSFAELEEWLESLNPPRFPTEQEIDVWMWLLAATPEKPEPEPDAPPAGGDALSLFCEDSV